MKLRVLAMLAALLVPVAGGPDGWPVASAQAPRKHALLIGISRYSVRPLDGPRNDVRSLAAMLRERFGFDSVRVVQDEQASRAGILRALDDLETTTSPGDTVLIYYSGHGTSALDRRLRLSGLSSYTGALLPSDFGLGSDREMLARVIIGGRDLRPRIERLEATRDVVAVFDTCYSANTARSLRVEDGSTSRSMPWDKISTRAMSFGEDDLPKEFGLETQGGEEYPYKRTLYLAAAGAGEEAEDISTARLTRYPTVDGQAHGAFTNALLKGLAGEANTNRDDVLTYRELFDFTRGDVARMFPHTPQMSVPAGRDDLLDRPVFGARGVARPLPASATVGPLRVLVRPELSASLVASLRGIPGVSLVTDGPHDLRLAPVAGGADVLHGSGDRLTEYRGMPSVVEQQLVARVSRQSRLHPLVNLRFPSQDFNVSADVAAPRGYLVLGETSTIRYQSELQAYLLILNIDIDGHVSVLYPFEDREARTATAQANSVLKVTAPTGTEFVKVMAFEQRPQGFEQWRGRDFDGSSAELDGLLAMIRSATGRRAQTLLKLVTAEK